MLILLKTFRNCKNLGYCLLFQFSLVTHSIFYRKLPLLNGGPNNLCQNVGFQKKCNELISNSSPFGDNMNRVYIASLSVGTRIWPFSIGTGSSRALFKSVVTNSCPDKPEMTDDFLNHILCTAENSAHGNREIFNDIKRLCKSGDVSAIGNLLHFLHSKRVFLDSDAYNILLAATSRKIVQMTSHCGALVLNRMIFAFGECTQIEKALLVFEHMKVLECKPDLFTYNTVIGLLARAGMVDDMLQEFASMKKANINPDIVTYNTLLNNLQKLGRFDLCLVYMREMDEKGLIPDLRTYTALIESLGRSGNIKDALRLFSAMKDRQVQPSIYIYRSLINNIKKMGKLETAASLLDEMNSSFPNLVGPKDFKKKYR